VVALEIDHALRRTGWFAGIVTLAMPVFVITIPEIVTLAPGANQTGRPETETDVCVVTGTIPWIDTTVVPAPATTVPVIQIGAELVLVATATLTVPKSVTTVPRTADTEILTAGSAEIDTAPLT
jgi:hypothetical protein